MPPRAEDELCLEHEARLNRSAEQIDALKRARLQDPVTPRMVLLVLSLALIAACILLGQQKVLPGEAIAGLLGALAGRLTSNIGVATVPDEGKGG